MTWKPKPLQAGKRVYFVSDLHLGAPTYVSSREREATFIKWIDAHVHDMQALYIVGDLFDFWFEYKHVVPKGHVRLLGKLAELTDAGIELICFTGNHDMWLFDYFPKELGAKVIRQQPIEINVGGLNIMIGHGDGLGPGDGVYKLIKKVFANRLCQRLFASLHPYIGFSIAQGWSGKSRLHNDARPAADNMMESEWLVSYCKEQSMLCHHDYYIFGHRHLPLNIAINERSQYINLGEWFKAQTFAWCDGQQVVLEKWGG